MREGYGLAVSEPLGRPLVEGLAPRLFVGYTLHVWHIRLLGPPRNGGPFLCCGGRITALLISHHQMGQILVGERRPPLLRERCPAVPHLGDNLWPSKDTNRRNELGRYP
jgi:hypothetical protein